jgi:hypothetical protein
MRRHVARSILVVAALSVGLAAPAGAVTHHRVFG